ncbi:MAG: MFS transporter [Candidatus Bathyarchaeota archaeon]|nr:MFS transporter [Candidatus Bathyarchaeota archaeon]
MFDDVFAFVKKQKKNFKMIIVRDFLILASGRRTQLRVQVVGYESIFLKRLGASSIEIGLINSVMSLVSILFSVPSGWLTDRVKNIKKMYVLSSGLGIINYLAMALTSSWPIYTVVNFWRTITDRLNMPAKTILDIDSLSNIDRVRGLSVHRTITAVGGIGGPIFAAYILTSFGGLNNVDSFRYLFLFQFVINAVIFLVMWRKLDDVLFDRDEGGTGVLKSFFSIFQGSSALKLFFVKDVIQSFFGLMARPFLGIYQVDVKLVTAFIIGYMGAGEMLVDVFLSLPMGGVISRFGRRKIAYIGHLIGLVARCILFLTPSSHPEFLILYSILGSVEGCMYLGWDAFTHEVVPQEVRGKYLGMRAVIVGIIGVIAPLLGGIIWSINPNYLWWINAIQWALVAFPLMVVLMEKYSS